jgi:hypothetical protein
MPPRRAIPVLALIGSVLAPAGAAPVRLLLDDLTLRTAELTEIADRAAVVRTGEDRPERIPLAGLIALSAGAPPTLPDFPVMSPATRVFVELVDGQRIAVDVEPSDQDEVLAGAAPGLGDARIPLERVARVARPGAPWRAPAPITDTVLLTNGDELLGFVLAVGPLVSIEADSGAVSEVPLDRVREIRLANPPAPSPGMLVTDDRGVTLAARSLEVGADAALTLRTDPGPLGIDSRGEDAIAYDRPDARIAALRTDAGSAPGVTALSAIVPESVEPTGARRWTPGPQPRPDADPAIGLGDVHMPAPAEAAYPVDPGATRFACDVRAAAPGEWTDCIVRVLARTADGARVVLGEHRLTRDNPSGVVRADLPENTRAIILVVDPGAHGAVQDAVTWEAPRIR